jgi:two-component system response regulator MprA
MDAARGKPTLVLVVEDEAKSARMLAQLLRDDGFDVELAFDGAAAISRLSRSPVPDALVTDFRMAHVDGVAVASYARSRQADMPVIIVTGYPELVQRLAHSLEPAAKVLVKPAPYSEISQLLSQVRKDGNVTAG